MTEFQKRLLKFLVKREENEQTRHEERMKMKERQLMLLEKLFQS